MRGACTCTGLCLWLLIVHFICGLPDSAMEVGIVRAGPLSLQSFEALPALAQNAIHMDAIEVNDPECKSVEWIVAIGDQLFQFYFGFPGGGMRPAGVLMKNDIIYAGFVEGEGYIGVECEESTTFMKWFYEFTSEGFVAQEFNFPTHDIF